MKKITREDFWMLDAIEAWDHVHALHKELDRLERVGSERKAMTVEEIERELISVKDHHDPESWGRLLSMIQPLTVQQGFVPDWSRAPKRDWLPTGVIVKWCWIPENEVKDSDVIQFIPIPTPKTMERTHQEKVHELMKKLTVDPVFQSVNKELVDDLCRAAGIDLKVTEE